MFGKVILVTLFVISFTLGISKQSQAQVFNALEECMTLSAENDQIHDCMDNYLDWMDESIDGITKFLADSLSGEALAGLQRSQQAFEDYRRQNCLWYLEFSSPREVGEQIGKNCLATMSQHRLQELRALVEVEDTTGLTMKGFYVYGAERNSFQPCGSDKRYWLEGDSSLVGRTQQQYLSTATSDLQVLFAIFAGSIDEQAQVPSGHDGVFNLSAAIELRVPTEKDCRLPGNAVPPSEPSIAPSASLNLPDNQAIGQEPDTQSDTSEAIAAYFGDWVVSCRRASNGRECRLSVELAGGQQAPEAEFNLVLNGVAGNSMEVSFAKREIDSPARIRWKVDAQVFGDIVGSQIRVDQQGTRQLVPASVYLNDVLVPRLISGKKLLLDVLESVDDEFGERYVGTLAGFSDALNFADAFIRDGGA